MGSKCTKSRSPSRGTKSPAAKEKSPDSRRSDDQRPEHSNEPPDSQTKDDHQSQRVESPAASCSMEQHPDLSDEPGTSHSEERTKDPSRCSVHDHPTTIVQMDVSLLKVLKPHMTSMKRLEGLREDIPGPGTSINSTYSTLHLSEVDSEGVNQQHEVWQLEKASKLDKTLLENTILCSDIFKPLPGRIKPIRVALTKGIAGIGKTFSVCKFAVDWGARVANQHIDLLILMSFRELNLVRDKQYSLLTLIHDFHPTLKTLTAEQLAACKTVVILDGLDESRIPLQFHSNDIVSDVAVTSSVGTLLTNLIDGNLLPSALLWITTRPAAANQIPSEYFDRVTEVRGFTDPQRNEYFKKRFVDEKLASTIISHINTTRIFYVMCHIPLFCWIAATVLEEILKTDETKQLPTTPTEMYSHFLLVLIMRNQQKYSQDANQQELMESDWNVLRKLGSLAFEHLEKGSIMFYQEDLEECGLDVKEASLYSGLCTEIFKGECVLFQTKVYSFIHLSIQEFLAAVYLMHCFNERKTEVLESFLKGYESDSPLYVFLGKIQLKALASKNGHLDLFNRFLHGLALESSQRLLGGLLGQRKNSPESIQRVIDNLKKIDYDESPDRCINIFHCLMEMKDDSVLQEIQQLLKPGNRSEKELTDTECSALAFMLLMSKEVLEEFDPMSYNASEFGRLRLLPAVRNCRKARLAVLIIDKILCEILVSALTSNPSHLLELELTDCFLHPPVMKQLCDAMRSPHCRLQKLRLSDCRLDQSSCKYLASVLRSESSSLQEFDLSTNDLGDDGVKELFLGLQSTQCRLEILSLRQTSITAKCCEELSSLLSSNSSCVRELDLSWNELQNEGIKILSAGLKSPHCTLEILRLSHCLVSEDGFSCLVSALTSNLSHLKELDLSFNHPGESQRETLRSVGLQTLKLDQEKNSLPPQLLKTCVCPLTLDTNTADTTLSLSKNNRKVTYTGERQSYPDHPDRFQGLPQVLCREALTGGCYWEADWSGLVHIALTTRGIKRGGYGDYCKLGYNKKSWSLECEGGEDNRYSVRHNKKRTVLRVRPSSGSYRVAVYVDCPAGRLSFYRVSSDTHTHLHTFQSTFTEPLYAGFYVWTKESSVSLRQIEAVLPSSVSPIVITENSTNEYRLQLPGAGLFQCRVTGLVFGTTGEGEILYRTVGWDERWLQTTAGTPAGPLFDILCPKKCVCQLGLPHCDVTPGDDLGVVHITDEGTQLLRPLRVTQTHLVVNVRHLSLYGLLWRFLNKLYPEPKTTVGQVLLFLRPPRDRLEMDVFLLPSNVAVQEVMVQHKKDERIKTPPTCDLTVGGVYSLHCLPHKVQPKTGRYHVAFEKNYQPTFEVFMDAKTEFISLKLRGADGELVWEREDLRVKGPPEPKIMDSLFVPDKMAFLIKNRKALVRNVKNIDDILDDLISWGLTGLAAKVSAETTDLNRMRKILDSVSSEALAETLFSALLEHQNDVMMELLSCQNAG